MTVYLLWHSYELETCGCDEAKFIGVYSTRALAEQAIERLKRQPGFADHPNGFVIDANDLDMDHWES